METTLDAAGLARALRASLDSLREHRRTIDSLNVYPVPDGDTGTNLVMTLEAICDAIGGVGARDDEVAHAIRSGSLMGARGNSGVILAQALRAFADVVEAGPAGPEQVAGAFKRAVDLAYESVLAPAEGTILTVLRVASDAAQGSFASVGEQIEAAARAAAAALERTREQMPVLARAGVVDAGAAGLVLIVNALGATLGASLMALHLAPRTATCVDGSIDRAYEVMYVLGAPEDVIPPLRQLLGTIGDSVAVVGGNGDWRVHVHTDDTHRAIALGQAIGSVSDIEIVAFAEQIAVHDGEVRDGGARGVDLARASRAASLIAVVREEGMAKLFRSCGAVVVSHRGELARAIAAAPQDDVIVLPNGEEARATALQGEPQAPKVVTVLKVGDVAQGLAAAVAFGDARSAAENLADMRAVLARVRTVAADRTEEALEAARALLQEGGEVLTILAGSGSAPDAFGALTSEFPAVAVEVHESGQSEPLYWLAVE